MRLKNTLSEESLQRPLKSGILSEEAEMLSGMLKLAGEETTTAFMEKNITLYKSSDLILAVREKCRTDEKMLCAALRLRVELEEESIKWLDERIKELGKKAMRMEVGKAKGAFTLSLSLLREHVVLFLRWREPLAEKIEARRMRNIFFSILEKAFSEKSIEESILGGLKKKYKGLYRKLLTLGKSAGRMDGGFKDAILSLNDGFIVEFRHRLNNFLEEKKHDVSSVILSTDKKLFIDKPKNGNSGLLEAAEAIRTARRFCAPLYTYAVCSHRLNTKSHFLAISIYPWRMESRAMRHVHKSILKAIKKIAKKKKRAFMKRMSDTVKKLKIKCRGIPARGERRVMSLVFYFESKKGEFNKEGIKQAIKWVYGFVYGEASKLVHERLEKEYIKKDIEFLNDVYEKFCAYKKVAYINYITGCKEDAIVSWFGWKYKGFKLG
jgi:hypothetical protein